MEKFTVIIEQKGRKVGECRLDEIGDPKSFNEIQSLTGRDWYILPAEEIEKDRWKVLIYNFKEQRR